MNSSCIWSPFLSIFNTKLEGCFIVMALMLAIEISRSRCDERNGAISGGAGSGGGSDSISDFYMIFFLVQLMHHQHFYWRRMRERAIIYGSRTWSIINRERDLVFMFQYCCWWGWWWWWGCDIEYQRTF